MKKTKKLNFPMFNPSDKEIEETRDRICKRYDIVIRQKDAEKLARLYKEIEWWFNIDKFSRNQKSISIETAKEIRGYFKKVEGKEMTLDEAHDFAKKAYTKTITSEKERIAKEIKVLIEKYQ